MTKTKQDTLSKTDVKKKKLTKPERSKAETKIKLSPFASSATVSRLFSNNVITGDRMDLFDAAEIMKNHSIEVNNGDLFIVESMLMSQAISLNSIYGELASKAATNMGQYMQAFELYMRLAFKAQAQCRATLETLAEVKSPRVTTFVRQQNNANQQQVNNAIMPSNSSPARAEKNCNPSNELLSEIQHEKVDHRGTAKTSKLNPELEPLEVINRAKDA